MLNPIYSILFNTKLNRWHPILFYESPLPSTPGYDTIIRHRSRGHHTAGFDNREDAIEFTKKDGSTLDSCRYSLEQDILWGGENTPAMTAYFLADENGTMHRAF